MSKIRWAGPALVILALLASPAAASEILWTKNGVGGQNVETIALLRPVYAYVGAVDSADIRAMAQIEVTGPTLIVDETSAAGYGLDWVLTEAIFHRGGRLIFALSASDSFGTPSGVPLLPWPTNVDRFEVTNYRTTSTVLPTGSIDFRFFYTATLWGEIPEPRSGVMFTLLGLCLVACRIGRRTPRSGISLAAR